MAGNGIGFLPICNLPDVNVIWHPPYSISKGGYKDSLLPPVDGIALGNRSFWSSTFRSACIREPEKQDWEFLMRGCWYAPVGIGGGQIISGHH